jgi:hypothetical protein
MAADPLRQAGRALHPRRPAGCNRLLHERLAGTFVALLAAFALLDATGAGRVDPGAMLAMGIGVAGLVIVLRTRPR